MSGRDRYSSKEELKKTMFVKNGSMGGSVPEDMDDKRLVAESLNVIEEQINVLKEMKERIDKIGILNEDKNDKK